MNVPQRINPQRLHEILFRHVRKQHWETRDARVGEEDVEAPVAPQRVVHNLLDGGLVGGVELPGVNLAARVQRRDLPLVVAQVFVVKVADVHSPGAVLGKLVRRGSPYSEGRVGAW